MKKFFLCAILFFGISQISFSQICFGVKAGINYNSDSFQGVLQDLSEGGKSKTGFHAGVWTRFKIPVIGLYLRPELIYTSLKSEYSSKLIPDNKATYDFQKIDIPVLLGKKFLKILNVFAGPSFQYIIDGDFNFESLGDIKTEADGLTVGVQLGAGVELGKLGLDIRWERAFSDKESELIINEGLPQRFDTRVNQIIVGLSYRF